jgi:hypothetical protein
MNKRKSIQICSWLLAILLLLGAAGFTSISAQAEDITLSPTIETLLTKKDSLQLADLLPALRELDQINLAYMQKPGWLHSLTERYNPFSEDNVGTPMEGLTPKLSQDEVWTFIEDETGTLGKASYYVVKDEAGQIVQVTAFDAEGFGGNLTLLQRGVEMEDQTQELPTSSAPMVLKGQLSNYIEDLIQFEQTTDTYEVWLEGNALHIAKTYQVENLEMEQFAEPVVAFRQDVAIDLTTGNYLSHSAEAILKSGKAEPWSSERTLLLEAGVQLPANVQENWEKALNSISEIEAGASQEKGETNSTSWCDTHAAYYSTNSRGPDYIYCWAKSNTENPIKTINVIGGKWVACSEKCGQTVVSYANTGSWPAYNASLATRGRYIALYECQPGLHRVSFTETTHQFVHNVCGGGSGYFEITNFSTAHVSD